jgi:predicted nucleic acid-binding protein
VAVLIYFYTLGGSEVLLMTKRGTHFSLAELLARLQSDALIALTAKRINAELWSKDGDMRVFCEALKVRLFVD